MRQLPGFAVAAALLSPIAGHAATFTFDHATVTMRGPIVAGDGAQLDRFLSAGHNNGHPLTTLVLISPGGLVAEGIALADAVRAYHVDTIVPPDAECASACFLPFAAGERMKVGQGARIGIHSATSTGGHGDDDGNATLVMARYAAQLGVPAALVGRMVETDSVNMTWLDDADLKTMGADVAFSRQQLAPIAAQGPQSRPSIASTDPIYMPRARMLAIPAVAISPSPGRPVETTPIQ